MIKPDILKIAALLMGLALAIPTSEATADPWTKTQDTLGLGTSAIKNPTPPKSANSDEGWKGNYVYYGQYHTDDARKTALTPVKYRVLRNGETRFTTDSTTGKSTPTLFLDCDKMLYATPFDRNTSTNVWEKCTTREYLNGTKNASDGRVFLDRALDTANAFSDAEKAAIVLSKYTSNNSTPLSADLVPTGLGSKGDYIFFLDITDVESKDYGYGSNGARKKKFRYDKPEEPRENNDKSGWKNDPVWDSWWLRSPVKDTNNKAGRIGDNGNYIVQKIPKPDVGASPAFNVKLSSVVFTSLVSGDAGEDGAEYKLTLLDASMDITPNTVTPNGNTVTVSYDVTGDHAGQATHVSVLVTDGEWTENGWTVGEVKYYKQFAITNNNKSVSFDLPGNYDVSSWKTYILAESVATCDSADKTTDYASAPKKLTLKFITATATGYNGDYDGQSHGVNVTVTAPTNDYAVKYGRAADACTENSLEITNVADSGTVWYQITADGYITKTGSADITISKANSEVTTAPNANELVYNGSAQPLVEAGAAKGGTMVYRLNDTTYSTDIPVGKNAGLYTIYYMVSGDANYNDVTSDDYKLTVNIERKSVTVRAFNKNKNRGEGDPALNATVSGLVNGENPNLIKYTLAREVGEAVGTYTITATGEKSQGNYAVTFVNGKLTIKQKSGGTGESDSNSGGTSGSSSQGTNGGTSNNVSQGTNGGTSNNVSQRANGGTSGSGSQGSDNGTAGNGSQGSDNGTTDNGSQGNNNGTTGSSSQGNAVGFEKAHKEVADVVEKKLTELLPGLPDDVEFFSDPDNMEFKGVNGLTSYIEKIIDELKGTVRELTAVMSPVSVKTAGVYFVKVNVTEEQSKELIGTRNLAYHIELYLENKEEAQVRIADAGEGESDVPTGKFVDENGDVVSGAYGGGDIYLLVYVPKADTTYVQYMTAEADQKPLEETTGNSSSPTSDSTSPSGYSGPTSNKGPGGCDAGFGGLAGLMILPLLARRRKK